MKQNNFFSFRECGEYFLLLLIAIIALVAISAAGSFIAGIVFRYLQS